MPEAFGSRTLREICRVLFSRWVGMILIVAIAAGGTWLACVQAVPWYRTAVTIHVKQPADTNPTIKDVSPDRSLEVFIKTQRQIIFSDLVMARTMARLEGSMADPPSETRDDAPALAIIEQRQDDLRKFREHVEVVTPGGEEVAMSEVFTIQVDRPRDPLDAKRAADLLAEEYIFRYRHVQAETNQRSAQFVQQQLAEIRRNTLDPAQERLRQFVAALDSPADVVVLEQLGKNVPEAGGQILRVNYQEKLSAIEGDLARARSLRDQVLEQIPPAARDPNTVDRLPSEALTRLTLVVPGSVMATNDIINKLQKKLADLIITRNRLEVEYEPGYRELVYINAEIDKAKREILRELKAEVKALQIEITAGEARRKDLADRLAAETDQLNKLSSQLVDYQRLQQELFVARGQYNGLADQLLEASMTEQQARQAIAVSVLEPASLPAADQPARPQPLLYTLIAAAAGLLLALAYAFLADSFDHTLKTIGEAERYLGLPVVGSVRKHGRRLVRT